MTVSRHPPLAPSATAAVTVLPTPAQGWPPSGLGPVAQVSERLPDPGDLRAGSWVAVCAGSASQGRGLARLLRRHRPAGVHLAVRCTALAARGYVCVCADAEGTAFGQVPA